MLLPPFVALRRSVTTAPTVDFNCAQGVADVTIVDDYLRLRVFKTRPEPRHLDDVSEAEPHYRVEIRGKLGPLYALVGGPGFRGFISLTPLDLARFARELIDAAGEAYRLEGGEMDECGRVTRDAHT